MSVAREKIDGVLQQMRQREERQRSAAGAWERSKDRCLAIAKALMDGTGVKVEMLNSMSAQGLVLTAKHRARAVFKFDDQTLAMIGTRFRGEIIGNGHITEPECGKGFDFFSLKIEPPARPQGYAQGQWGQSRPEGIGDLNARLDSQAAFEKAIADWFEWAHMGDGAPLAGA